MKITAEFIHLLAAVAYGSTAIAALPTFNAHNYYSTRELSSDIIHGRDLFYLDIRDLEDIQKRQVLHPPHAMPIAPPSSLRTETEQAIHNLALADHTHPGREKAIDEERKENAYWNGLLAHPAHPDHSQAVAHKQEKNNQRDADWVSHYRLSGPEYEAAHARQMKEALTDPTHPWHNKAQHEEEHKRKQHTDALRDPNHHDHHEALAKDYDHQAAIHALSGEQHTRKAAEHMHASAKHTQSADANIRKARAHAAEAAAARRKKNVLGLHLHG